MDTEITGHSQNTKEYFDNDDMKAEAVGDQLEDDIIGKPSNGIHVQCEDEQQMEFFDTDEFKLPQKPCDDDKNVENCVTNGFEMFDFDIPNSTKLEKNALFPDKYSAMRGLVIWRSKLVLFIDIRMNNAKPDFVDSILNEIDENVKINHQWRKRQRQASLWDGAVAFFEDPKCARKTKTCLKTSKYLTVVPIREILNVLIEAEIRYPDCSETSTGLIIRAKETLPRKTERAISAQLRRFGQVTEIKFQPYIHPGEICRAWYRYASHAILAKLICEQSTVPDVGTVSVEVIFTRKEESIMGYMKNYVQNIL